jgi:alanine racemase
MAHRLIPQVAVHATSRSQVTPHLADIRPTRAEIDLARLVANVAGLRQRLAPNVQILGVVKADAYGHGAVPVARALAPVVEGLAVSLSEEGFELRSAGLQTPILVMGGVYGHAHRDLVAANLVPMVSDPADVRAFARAAASLGVRASLHLKVDTGMSRLGIRLERVDDLLAAAAAEPSIQVTGFATHLAAAEEEDPTFTQEQLARFDAALLRARAYLPGPLLVHAANSAATLCHPASHHLAVRPGLALYQGVMRLVSAVVSLRSIQPGDAVSYGHLWRAQRPTTVATVPCGYADGYPRRLTGHGEVLVSGKRCPVLGAVCMDMIMVDVTDVSAKLGDEVVLLGGDVTAAELAERAGLIEYEITCGISKRVPRVYTGAA